MTSEYISALPRIAGVDHPRQLGISQVWVNGEAYFLAADCNRRVEVSEDFEYRSRQRSLLRNCQRIVLRRADALRLQPGHERLLPLRIHQNGEQMPAGIRPRR